MRLSGVLGVFFEIMHAPSDRNLSDWFVAGGFNWKGPIPGRPADVFGLAFSYAGIGAAARNFRYYGANATIPEMQQSGRIAT